MIQGKSELSTGLSGTVFQVPDQLIKIMDRDLEVAGIPKVDERGRTVDVHALRHTFGTMLSMSGVSPRTAQAAMRHSKIDLTMNVYTDPKMLDVHQAVESLPKLNARLEFDKIDNSWDALRDAPDFVQTCHSGTFSDQTEQEDDQLSLEAVSVEKPRNKHKKTLLTSSVIKVLSTRKTRLGTQYVPTRIIKPHPRRVLRKKTGDQRDSNPRPSEPQSDLQTPQHIDDKQLTTFDNSRRTDGRTNFQERLIIEACQDAELLKLVLNWNKLEVHTKREILRLVSG